MDSNRKQKILRWLKRCLIVVAVLLCVLVIGIECFLRWHYGLCDAVLMRADDDYEYIAQPNQNRRRFGKRVIYNSLSMRCGELRESAEKILVVGDSVVNGGTLTDQAELATTLLEEQLCKETGRDIQVLNVSAGSWGPDNCAAYLNKHGCFGAKAMVLVCSSHDAKDTMTFAPAVGVLKYYPVRQYKLALFELFDRYLCPQNRMFHRTKDEADAIFRKEHHIEQTDVVFNPGFSELQKIAKEKNMPFFVCLHATLDESKIGKYNEMGQDIIDFCKNNSIILLKDMDYGVNVEHFRSNDFIHCSPKGQELLVKMVSDGLNNCGCNL